MSKIENGEEVIRHMSERQGWQIVLPTVGRLKRSRSRCMVRLEWDSRLTGSILSLSNFVQFFGRTFQRDRQSELVRVLKDQSAMEVRHVAKKTGYLPSSDRFRLRKSVGRAEPHVVPRQRQSCLHCPPEPCRLKSGRRI